jgi:hypothetical protein
VTTNVRTESDATEPRPHTFRSPINIGICFVSSAGIGGIFLGYAIVEWPSIAVAAVNFIGFAIAAWLAIRIVRSGIIASSGGLEIRGFARTKHVAWQEVKGFRTLAGSPLNRSVYLAVELRDGSTVRTSGLTSATPGKRAQRILAQLEALRRSSANEIRVQPPTSSAAQ